MSGFEAFFKPYLAFLVGAAFNLQQTLEGLGLRSSAFPVFDETQTKIVGSYWSATEATVAPLLALFGIACVVLLIFVAAWHAVAGWRGVLIAGLLLIAPGVLSVAGVFPSVNWIPRTYLSGTGLLGSPWGMLALASIALAAGWSAVVLVSKTLRLTDRFRHAYDHVWYAMAITAGLFFVADVDAALRRDDFQRMAADGRAASAYLLEQARRLASACQKGAVDGQLACNWASTVQWKLLQYAHYSDRVYSQLGPTEQLSLYALPEAYGGAAAVQRLRAELLRYNRQRCPVHALGAGVQQRSPVSAEPPVPI